MHSPMPTPSTSMNSEIRRNPVSASIVDISSRPAVMKSDPRIGEDLVAAGATDDRPGRDRGDEQPEHHRQRPESGRGGGDTVHVLQVGRQERHRAEHREADDERDHRGQREHRALEQVQRQHRLGGPTLGEHERWDAEQRSDEQADDQPRRPVVLRPAEAGGEGQPTGDERDRGDAGVVDRRPPVRAHRGHRLRGDGDDEDADRHVDDEAPVPGQVVGEEPAEQRPDHGGDAEDGSERALVLAALTQRDDVGDQGGRRDHQAAGADALDGAPGDQPAMDSASAHISEAATNSPALSWKMSLRPNRSPNLPASTVAMVSVSR